MRSSGFLSDIHFFRGLSIVLIVSSHIWYANVESPFYMVASAFFLNSTMFFAFISGFLFQYLLKNYSYFSYLKRKLQFVVLPYILVSIPAVVLRIKTGPSFLAQLNNPDIAAESTFQQILYYYTTGAHQLPLWYLPMVTIFFLLAPVFKFIDDNPKLYWLLTLFFILSLLLPRGDFAQLNNIPRMFGHFLFVYVFGMFFSHYKPLMQRFTQKNLTWILMVFTLFFVLSLYDQPYRHQIIFVQKFFAIFLLLYLLQSVKKRWMQTSFDQLAITSFGIYFVHFYVIQTIRKISERTLETEYPDNILLWFFTFSGVVLISYGVVVTLKLIFRKASRYLIGS